MNKKNRKSNKTFYIIFFLFILYGSAVENYSTSGNEYFINNSDWLALIDLAITSAFLMILPLICRLVNKKRFNLVEGKEICRLNSIIAFGISLILLYGGGWGFIGGLGSILYYFINKWIFVDEYSLPDDNINNLTKKSNSFYESFDNNEEVVISSISDFKKERYLWEMTSIRILLVLIIWIFFLSWLVPSLLYGFNIYYAIILIISSIIIIAVVYRIIVSDQDKKQSIKKKKIIKKLQKYQCLNCGANVKHLQPVCEECNSKLNW